MRISDEELEKTIKVYGFLEETASYPLLDLRDLRERLKKLETAARDALRWLEDANLSHENVCNGVHAPNGVCEGSVWFTEMTYALREALEDKPC